FRRNKRVGSFLNPIMEETVPSFLRDNGTRLYGSAKALVHLDGHNVACWARVVFGAAMHLCQRRKISLIAEASEQLQCFLSCIRQASQPADYEIQKIVGRTLAGDAVEVPRPGSLMPIEREKVLLRQACEKLDGEKGIAARLPMYELGQRPNIRRLTANSIAKQLIDIAG